MRNQVEAELIHRGLVEDAEPQEDNDEFMQMIEAELAKRGLIEAGTHTGIKGMLHWCPTPGKM